MGLADWRDDLKDKFSGDSDGTGGGKLGKLAGIATVILLIVIIILGMYWSNEPESFNVRENATAKAAALNKPEVTGFTSTATAIRIGETLLDKPGGYLRNDIMPPGLYLDNMPNWEFGALVQLRDFTRAMRKDFSRSQSQSKEDVDLAIAEPQFNFDSKSWALPSSEGEYRRGIDKLDNYLARLSDSNDPAQFYTRADNLTQWLRDVETRLGSLSQRLSASVGKNRLNTDLAGDAEAGQSTPMSDELMVQTPWNKIDDVFYEARGTTWALIVLLQAIEVDFADVLEKKNALVSLRQIIRELQETQQSVWSPIILNGDGFGILANHSLVMANYISRANAAIIDLRALLTQG
ncbi:DUF2333 family protein [Parendozoicomonas haliclonae]|uniref:DUF2333 domain-containing protein n=1 Tax=Parendozoicomonas haliclonae TaxID=1960125 RepID=A0A1X7AJ10_9GAMM|nr:DUF2333 family protein [Parendozoicomonas haliclonae]SMA45092.1 hypothetical protein EHSB41UT_01839 [Parendozoicomonas haliclonae]